MSYNYAYRPRPRRFVNSNFARWDSGVFPRAETLACFPGSLAEPRLLRRGEGLVICLYATCSTVMLGYVITNRKRGTFRNTRYNAGVFSLALFLLNKLSLHRMASASHIHTPASGLGIIIRARSSNQSLHARQRCIRSPIATGHGNSLYYFASPFVFKRVGAVITSQLCWL